LCGNEHAYEAFSSQECAKNGCSNFTERQRDAVDAELEAIEEANREYDLAQAALNDAGPEEERDTEPPGPPDEQQDDTDPYIWAQPPYAVPAPKPPPKKAIAAPKKDTDKQTDIDTYFDIPWSDPHDMSLD